ncbi:MAG TPA: S16 family serine protease, partial [Steroidobacteraceae bacterium]
EGAITQQSIDVDDIQPILGPPRFENEVAMRTSVPGVATGLAWTPVGGDILFIEATRVPGNGKLILTGQLGEVMKESAQAALSLVKSQAGKLGIDASLFEKSDVHIHVPAGAIPKDGPSAGVAMFTALVSLMSGKTVGSDLAMTGEISLRGLVLPVGGIKEKVVAAHRAGIRKVLLPARNQKDLEEVPQIVRDEIKFVFCERVDDVAREALGIEFNTAVTAAA